MFRYRCPHCVQLLPAHELRAGKKSVCAVCLASHVIPADPGDWLTETGEPVAPRVEPPRAATAEQGANPVAVATPAPQPAEQPTPRLVVRMNGTPLPVPADTPMPVVQAAHRLDTPPVTNGTVAPIGYGDPVNVRTQADIAGALSEVLSRRMKPPRQPRRDLRPSTAVWLVLSGVAAMFFLATLVSAANYSWWVGALGVVQILLGYGWIVWLTSQRNPQRGVACAVPPITLYFLAQWKYAKLRPMRFVVTGVALLGLALLTPSIAPRTRELVGTGKRGTSTQPELADQSKLEQLRTLRDQKAYDKLIELLRVLTATDAQQSVDARDRPALAGEIKALCSHQDVGVKVAAMAAYTRWGGDDARDVCLAAIQSQSQDERMMAVALLPQWKDSDAAPEVARAVAALIGRPGVETNRARTALEEIGGVAAERAAVALLLRADDRPAKLVALTILEKVGGDESIGSLRSYANTNLDQAVKLKTLETVELIQKRLNKK